jgi:hypothetical protein
MFSYAIFIWRYYKGGLASGKGARGPVEGGGGHMVLRAVWKKGLRRLVLTPWELSRLWAGSAGFL